MERICVITSVRCRSQRSTQTPATGARKNIGTCEQKLTVPSRTADPVSRYTSQLVASRVIQVPISEVGLPGEKEPVIAGLQRAQREGETAHAFILTEPVRKLRNLSYTFLWRRHSYLPRRHPAERLANRSRTSSVLSVVWSHSNSRVVYSVRTRSGEPDRTSEAPRGALEGGSLLSHGVDRIQRVHSDIAVIGGRVGKPDQNVERLLHVVIPAVPAECFGRGDPHLGDASSRALTSAAWDFSTSSAPRIRTPITPQ